MINPMDLPPVNAGLNSLSALLLLAGYIFIRRGEQKKHAACMVGALVTNGKGECDHSAIANFVEQMADTTISGAVSTIT